MTSSGQQKQRSTIFKRPGKPTDNAYIESFNGRLRDECLDSNVFEDLDEVRKTIDEWRKDYNNWRHHSSLGNKTPMEYRRLHRNAESLEMTRAF